MGRVTVKRNDLPEIIKKLPRAIDDAVDEQARVMAKEIQQVVWYRYGYIEQATQARTAGEMHAEVWCGFNRSTGFYSRFQEWGTRYQAARPIVGPNAHANEPVYAKRVADAVREACNA